MPHACAVRCESCEETAAETPHGVAIITGGEGESAGGAPQHPRNIAGACAKVQDRTLYSQRKLERKIEHDEVQQLHIGARRSAREQSGFTTKGACVCDFAMCVKEKECVYVCGCSNCCKWTWCSLTGITSIRPQASRLASLRSVPFFCTLSAFRGRNSTREKREE